MICPKCGHESNGSKWCEKCGVRLELNDIGLNGNFNDEPLEESTYNSKGENLNQKSAGGLNNANAVTQSYAHGGYEDDREDYEIDDEKAKPVRDSNKAMKIAIAVIAPITALFLIFAILIVADVFDSDDSGKSGNNNDKSSASSAEVLENEEVKSLMKKGEKYMNVGDYEAAEAVYKTVVDKDVDNEEAEILYRILYNYNRALKKLDTKKYEDARELYNKIPDEYVNYSICDHVEKLEDEITNYEIASEVFENIERHMRNDEFDSAEELIEVIDKSYLLDDDIRKLNEYIEEIEERKNQNSISAAQAEELILKYCDLYIKSINEQDTSYLSQCLRGELYTTQVGVVNAWIEQRCTERFNFLDFHELRKISSKSWEADVTESLVVIYPDGEEVVSINDWTYTIEYIGKEYYLTKIRKTYSE